MLGNRDAERSKEHIRERLEVLNKGRRRERQCRKGTTKRCDEGERKRTERGVKKRDKRQTRDSNKRNKNEDKCDEKDGRRQTERW